MMLSLLLEWCWGETLECFCGSFALGTLQAGEALYCPVTLECPVLPCYTGMPCIALLHCTALYCTAASFLASQSVSHALLVQSKVKQVPSG